MRVDTPFLERVYFALRNGGYFSVSSTTLLARFNALPQVTEGR